jgi:hypothetical protein
MGSGALYSPLESYTNCCRDALPRDRLIRTRFRRGLARGTLGLAVFCLTSYLPVPVRFEICGVPAALSATCKVPVVAPVAVGVNTTLMVQVDLAANVVVQVVAETLNFPVVEITMLVSATACLLASVNFTAGLDTPTFSVGNVLLTGVNVA